jgi:hypothetical protein
VTANDAQPKSEAMKRAGRVVFITRFYPYPQRAGAWIYTAQMIALWSRLAQHIDVFCAIRGGEPSEPAPINERVSYHFGELRVSSPLRYLLSGEPKAASDFCTNGNRQALFELLSKVRPDVIVVDHIGATWAMPVIERYLKQAPTHPTIIYVTHNAETETRLSIARQARFPSNLPQLFDAARIHSRDRDMLRLADLITCNTPQDLAAYLRERDVAGVVLNPIYTRSVVEARTLDTSLPRKIVIVSSFLWSAKLINLTRFLTVAAPIAAERGIEIHVVGRMTERDKTALGKSYPGIVFHGEVASVEPHIADARLGLLIDEAGGGFKHTALTYAFNRIPIGALRGALSESRWGQFCVLADTPGELVRLAADAIDDFKRLNAMQRGLFNEVEPYLSESNNLASLRSALEALPVTQSAVSDG